MNVIVIGGSIKILKNFVKKLRNVDHHVLIPKKEEFQRKQPELVLRKLVGNLDYDLIFLQLGIFGGWN